MLSIGLDETVLSTIGTPISAAAAAVALSASSFRIDCTPIGARMKGEGRVSPKSRICIFLTDTSRNILGTIIRRMNAIRLADTVISEPAPPAT